MNSLAPGPGSTGIITRIPSQPSQIVDGTDINTSRRFYLSWSKSLATTEGGFAWEGPREGYTWYIEYAAFGASNIFSGSNFIIAILNFTFNGDFLDFPSQIYMNGKRNSVLEALNSLNTNFAQPLLWEPGLYLGARLLTDFPGPTLALFSAKIQVLERKD